MEVWKSFGKFFSSLSLSHLSILKFYFRYFFNSRQIFSETFTFNLRRCFFDRLRNVLFRHDKLFFIKTLAFIIFFVFHFMLFSLCISLCKLDLFIYVIYHDSFFTMRFIPRTFYFVIERRDETWDDFWISRLNWEPNKNHTRSLQET